MKYSLFTALAGILLHSTMAHAECVGTKGSITSPQICFTTGIQTDTGKSKCIKKMKATITSIDPSKNGNQEWKLYATDANGTHDVRLNSAFEIWSKDYDVCGSVAASGAAIGVKGTTTSKNFTLSPPDSCKCTKPLITIAPGQFCGETKCQAELALTASNLIPGKKYFIWISKGVCLDATCGETEFSASADSSGKIYYRAMGCSGCNGDIYPGGQVCLKGNTVDFRRFGKPSPNNITISARLSDENHRKIAESLPIGLTKTDTCKKKGY